jgi:hypothetical protein
MNIHLQYAKNSPDPSYVWLVETLIFCFFSTIKTPPKVQTKSASLSLLQNIKNNQKNIKNP